MWLSTPVLFDLAVEAFIETYSQWATEFKPLFEYIDDEELLASTTALLATRPTTTIRSSSV
eukprot:1470810-Lingulodinium_polyedra.AAC.1